MFFSTASLSSDYTVCEEIAKKVEYKRGLPENILTSIALVEAGRKYTNGEIMSWPWSLNHAGTSLFFDNKSDALKYLKQNISKTFKNIDVGCMQVNVKWHSKNFDSFENMLDPLKNIQYAASFLADLKRKHGSWEKAIKYYHSSTTKLNVKYYAKVSAVWNAKQRPTELAQKAALFLDDNIFYDSDTETKSSDSRSLGNKSLVEYSKPMIKSASGKSDYDEDSIYFNAVLLGNRRLGTSEELKRYIKYKSAYLRENIDMILLFRQEFSKEK